MGIALYTTAMQTVPLLLIALFLDIRTPHEDSRMSQRLRRLQGAMDRIFAVLGFVAFMTSLLVVAGAIDAGPVAAAIVIAALSGSMGLLFSRIWGRFSGGGGRPAG